MSPISLESFVEALADVGGERFQLSPRMTCKSSAPSGTMKRPYSSLAENSWLRWSQIAISTRFGYSDFAGSHLKNACANSL